MTIEEAVKHYRELHEESDGGCKSSCNEVEMVLLFDDENEGKYEIRFGGYCFSGLDRLHCTKSYHLLNDAIKEFIDLIEKNPVDNIFCDPDESWSD